MKDNKITFYLPDFYFKHDLNIEFITIFKEHPEYFYDNVEIGSIYGSFPSAIWNGGRVMHGMCLSEKINNIISNFNSLDMPLRFTFTNSLLEEKHIYDTYCNLIMEYANNGKNEVLTNSIILENYLRENYPNFKYIASTTQGLRDIDKINKACDKYDLVVTDSRDNRDFNLLNQIKDKNKIELLANPYCYPECNQRAMHYLWASENQLSFSTPSIIPCDVNSHSFFEILERSVVLKLDDVYGLYADLGFHNFKIEGRSFHSMDVIESYVYYLIKPEFKDLVRYKLVKACWKQNYY